MRNLLLVVGFGLFTSFTSVAQPNTVVKEKIQKAHQSFLNGILAEDYKQIEELLAEDVTLGFPDGGFTPKKVYVNALKSGSLFYDSSSNQSFNIRIYGNIGVVNGKGNLVFRYKNDKGEWYKMLEHLTYSTVYVIDKNKVKMVSWQSNRPTTDKIVKVKE